MNNNIISNTINQTNLKEKQIDKGTPLTLNLSLLSNKSSIDALMSIAKKQKSGPIKKPIENGEEEISPNSKYSSITFEPQTKEIHREILNENNQSTMSEGMKFLRAQRKGPVSNSTRIQGKLDIMKKLDNNVNSQMKKEALQSVKSQEEIQQPKESMNEYYRKGISSSVKYPKKSLFNQNSNEIQEKKENTYDNHYYTIKKALSVVEFSYREDQNYSYKDSMEDMGKAVDGFNNNSYEGLFCLFDGHGGTSVSQYLQSNYPYCFKQAQSNSQGNIELALKTSFKNIDKELQNLDLVNVGSTGCVIYVTKENDSLIVYTANVGDTRCSLISPLKNKRLTIDHKANDPEEKQRIINSGGNVINDRVMGLLMLSRAFGDFELKSFGVKADPYISRTVIDRDEKNQILICASDGVWDILSEEDIQNYIMFNNDTGELCKTIMKNTLSKGSWDNISCFAIKLT